MKTFILIITCTLLAVGCKSQSKGNVLDAETFASKHEKDQSIPVIDVRSPEEFAKGNIGGSVNINWNGPSFEKEIAAYDKSKPVMVYCLAGSRSAAAADKMRSMGFTEVYELDGGMMKWRSAELPERRSKTTSNAFNKAKLEEVLKSDKLILLDFYAEWCLPCRKMKPDLEAIAKEESATVEVYRIDIDDNPELAKALAVSSLPVVKIYKGGEEMYTVTGYVSKAEIITQIRKLR